MRSILSPYILPLLPVVAGKAVSAHRCGPLALAAGLALSFMAIGIFVATIGFSIGLGGSQFQSMSAVLLILLGIVLLFPKLQTQFAAAKMVLGSVLILSGALIVTGLDQVLEAALVLHASVWLLQLTSRY